MGNPDAGGARPRAFRRKAGTGREAAEDRIQTENPCRWQPTIVFRDQKRTGLAPSVAGRSGFADGSVGMAGSCPPGAKGESQGQASNKLAAGATELHA